MFARLQFPALVAGVILFAAALEEAQAARIQYVLHSEDQDAKLFRGSSELPAKNFSLFFHDNPLSAVLDTDAGTFEITGITHGCIVDCSEQGSFRDKDGVLVYTGGFLWQAQWDQLDFAGTDQIRSRDFSLNILQMDKPRPLGENLNAGLFIAPGTAFSLDISPLGGSNLLQGVANIQMLASWFGPFESDDDRIHAILNWHFTLEETVGGSSGEIPEPATALLLIAGLLGAKRRRQ